MAKIIPLKWHTEKRKVKDLILYEENPREMTEKQKDDILKSLRKKLMTFAANLKT